MRYFIALTLSASFDFLEPRDSHIYVTMHAVADSILTLKLIFVKSLLINTYHDQSNDALIS